MPRQKKKTEKKKPEIIARFFRLARHRAEENGFDIEKICEKFDRSQASIYNYEDERHKLNYDQLRVFVEFYGLPAGVMLLITRLTAELRDGHHENAEQIARGVIAVANHIIDNKATLTARDYHTDNGGGQDQTLLELWQAYKINGLYLPGWPEPERR